MTDAATDTAGTPARKSRLWIAGLALVPLLGGGGFYATYARLVPWPGGGGGHAEPAAALPDIAFVPVDPVIVSLGPQSGGRHLKFTAQLEVAAAYQAEVAHLMPRILDVLNGYLRAVEIAALEDRSAMTRLRAQMLRRVQIVTGEGRVRDLLVTEFILN